MTISKLIESFKTMIRLDGTLFDGLFLGKYKRYKKYKRTWNFNIIFIQVFNLCYQHLGLISLTVWKLRGFQQFQ